MRTPQLSRRDWFRVSAGLGLAGAGWLPELAHATARDPQRKRSCILLWMSGGPATIDLFDLKPGHTNGGPVQQNRAAPRPLVWARFSEPAEHRQRPSGRRAMATQGRGPRP